MCGITGILDLKKRSIPNGLVEKMTDTISYRGPNDQGFFVQGPIAFGHRRLSILDVSAAGHQPMKDNSGEIVITFNGEVYNYIELKKDLKKKNYRGGSDTEVILEAYKEKDTQCVNSFNGIFAFAIWDSKKQRLFCARDHLGVKPFYYAIHAGKFFFGSEIKTLLAGGVPAIPNDKIIHDYLVYGTYEHSEETFFSNIKQLLPGYAMTIKGGKIETFRYWNLSEKVKNLDNLSDKEVVKQYRELVDDSVRMELRSDVPVGLNVSGGLDASIITEVANRISGGQQNFELYSGNYGEEKYDETPYVQELARHLGWNVDFVTLRPNTAIELLPEVMRHQEQPFPGISIVMRYNLYKNIRPETIVFLEGHGGDEISGGYDYYFSSFLLDMIKSFGPEEAKKELEAFCKSRGISSGDPQLKFFMNGLSAYFGGRVSADATSFGSSSVLNKNFFENKLWQKPEFEKPFDSFLTNMQYKELGSTKVPRMLRCVDRNSMAFGKEVRVPLLDHRIAEFGLSLGIRHKIRNGEMRFFMREAFRDRLSHQNVSLPKRSLPDPQREWLRGPLRKFTQDLLSSKEFGGRPYFNQKEAIKEFKNYCENKEVNNSVHIWQMINMELWLRAFID